MNRRTLLSTVPGLAAAGLFARFPNTLFAQSAPPAGPFQQASADYLRSSVAVASALTSSLQTVGSQQKSGTLQPFAIQLASSSYNTWVSNLAEVNFFADFDSVAKADPSAVIDTPLSTTTITQGIQQANALGFTTATPEAFLGSLQSYQSTLTTSAVLEHASTGSQALFSQLGLALTNGFVGPQPIPQQASSVNPDHSADCNAFFYLGVVSAVTLNEVAALACGIEMWLLSC